MGLSRPGVSPKHSAARHRFTGPIQRAQVAQLVEHATENRSVGGSIPPLGTIPSRSVPAERPRSGTGRGLTVRQIIDEVERITGRKVPHVMKPRRPGDPPELYAHVGLAEKELGFRARRSDIEAIVSSAWPYFRDRR